MLFAYFGPETYLPLSSTLVAIVGFLLMCGRQSLRWVGHGIGSIFRLFRPKSPTSSVPAPHVLSRRPRPEKSNVTDQTRP